MYVVNLCVEGCNLRYQAILESVFLLRAIIDPKDATTHSMEHPYFSRNMFRFCCWRKCEERKGKMQHGPGSDGCSRANQSALGSYWGDLCTPSVVARPGTLPPAIRLSINWLLPSEPGFPAETPTGSSRLLGCLLLASISLHQIVRFLSIAGIL